METVAPIEYGKVFASILAAALIAFLIIKAFKKTPDKTLFAENVYKLEKNYLGPIVVFAACGTFIVLGVILVFVYIAGHNSSESNISPSAPFVGSLFVAIPAYIIYRFNKEFSQYIVIKVKGRHLEICYPKNPSKNKNVAIKECEIKMFEWWTGDEDTPLHYAGPLLNLKYDKDKPSLYIKTYARFIKWKEAKKSNMLEVKLYSLKENRWRKLISELGLEGKLEQ